MHLKPKYERPCGSNMIHSCWFSVTGNFHLFSFASQWTEFPNSALAVGKSQAVLSYQKYFPLRIQYSVGTTGSKGEKPACKGKVLMLAHTLHLPFRPGWQMDLPTAWRESSEVQANPAPSLCYSLQMKSIGGSGSRQPVIRVKDRIVANKGGVMLRMYGWEYFQKPSPLILSHTRWSCHTHPPHTHTCTCTHTHT